jgi:heat shock protein beta
LGSSIKLGAVEAEGNKQKLAGLCKFASNQNEQRNGSMTTLDEYAKNKKRGQTQIFFLAGMGQTIDMLASSLFVEKLSARVSSWMFFVFLPSFPVLLILPQGYEVLLVNEPLDEIMFTQLRTWEKLSFQDVTKAGLKFGDEGVYIPLSLFTF